MSTSAAGAAHAPEQGVIRVAKLSPRHGPAHHLEGRDHKHCVSKDKDGNDILVGQIAVPQSTT